MAKFGNFKTDESSLRDKVLFKNFMAGHYDQFIYKGVTVKAKPFKRKTPKILDQSKDEPEEKE